MSVQKHLINTDYYLLLKKQQLNFEVLIPFIKFSDELQRELVRKQIKVFHCDEKIFLIEPSSQTIIWAQDHWKSCKLSSVDQALYTELKSLPCLGYYHPTDRNKSIEKKLINLKKIPQKRIKFNLAKKFNLKYYVWTCFEDSVIYSTQPKARYPAGWNEFDEDKENPPNRAYLKLWEALAVHDLNVKKDQHAIEIGASPGGWSWCLSQICKQVYTFDRAPLADKIAQRKNIEHVIGDAFKISPKDYLHAEWFFSDLICTPDKIQDTILSWLDVSPDKNFMCTIKFKGQCDFEVVENLLKIPHSKVIRLYHNKNEVTWIRQVPD